MYSTQEGTYVHSAGADLNLQSKVTYRRMMMIIVDGNDDDNNCGDDFDRWWW